MARNLLAELWNEYQDFIVETEKAGIPRNDFSFDILNKIQKILKAQGVPFSAVDNRFRISK